MIKRLSILVYILSLGLTCQCQDFFAESKITDHRDGKSYKTLTINKTTWLAENMRYKTEEVDIVKENYYGNEVDDYYYPHYESDEVCPAGFRIPKESEWKDYVHTLLALKEISKSAISDHFHKSRRVTGSSLTVMDSTFSFFNDPNPLNIKISGMMQGDEYVSDDAHNFWSRRDGIDDNKYHLHIQKSHYGNHSHRHHIFTKKIRREGSLWFDV